MRRPVTIAAIVLAVALVSLTAMRRSGHVERGPISVANAGFTEPTVTTDAGFPVILASNAPETLVPDQIFPENSSSILWFQGRATGPYGERRIAVDGAGGVIKFGGNLRPKMIKFDVDGREIVSAAPLPDGGHWLVASTGEFIRTDAEGAIEVLTHSPFDYAHVTSDPAGNVWAVRSPIQFSMRWERSGAPAIVKIAADGTTDGSLGSVVVPADFMLSQLASSGYVAFTEDVVYYGPFVRDQVIAMNYQGDTLWIAERGLEQEAEEPRFLVEDGVPLVDYSPVNKGLAIGPDGKLYALSVPGFTVSKSRLDVYEPTTGQLLRSAIIDNSLPTLSVDAEGRVYLIDEFRLMTGVPPRERIAFADFELEMLNGEHLENRDLHGQVTLINFWASWCEPCRVEMPALDSLRASITDPEFQFMTFNEDVNVDDARGFLDEYGFEFPVALGRGRLKNTYHYMGLPFTVLVDREGKVVQRWIGFAGEGQIQSIRSVTIAELERGVAMEMMDHGSDVGQSSGSMEGMDHSR